MKLVLCPLHIALLEEGWSNVSGRPIKVKAEKSNNSDLGEFLLLGNGQFCDADEFLLTLILEN